MKRNLKALGLAMVAVFALSAVAASAAQATEHHLKTPEFKKSIITAEDHVNTVFSITEGNRKVECTTSKYEGTVAEEQVTEVTVTPTYSGCKIVGLGINVTVDVNHCAYVLKGVTDAKGDATAGIECSGTDEITLTYSVFGSSCVIHVTPQSPETGGVHYTSTTNPTTGKTDVTIEVTSTGIKYHETGGGFCPASSTGADGTLNGAVTAQAYEDEALTTQTGTDKTTPSFTEGKAIDLDLVTTP